MFLNLYICLPHIHVQLARNCYHGLLSIGGLRRIAENACNLGTSTKATVSTCVRWKMKKLIKMG